VTTKDKLICAIYALIALLAIPATWINNIAFMKQPNNSFMDFVNAAYVNTAAASLSNDLLFIAIAVSMFMAISDPTTDRLIGRIGIRHTNSGQIARLEHANVWNLGFWTHPKIKVKAT
jgi:Terpene cyclase DEP1